MKASFTCAVRYRVTARCLSPLRTAGAEGGMDSVLRGADGVYRLQGSSIAGALREWLSTEEGEARAERLFGAGDLIVSDGVFSETARLAQRPRLRIDGRTGSAADRGKFDVAHLDSGAEFDFSIVWLGDRERLGDTEDVERMLGALHHGAVLLGAQKTNGFGRVSLRVQKQSYDLFRPEDRESWLSGRENGKDLKLPQPRERRVVLCLRGSTNSLLVRASAAEQEAGGSYTPNLTENGTPVIPGSSVKGAVRARTEQIAAFLGLPETVTHGLFGYAGTIGEEGAAGQVRFDEILFPEVKKQKITRIRINRLTGGVIRQGLFREEPVSGSFALRLSLPAEDRAGCMLLVYALRDLGLGLYNLGSDGAVGRGFLKAETLQAETPEGQSLRLQFRDGEVSSVSDPDSLLTQWRKALEAMR